MTVAKHCPTCRTQYPSVSTNNFCAKDGTPLAEGQAPGPSASTGAPPVIVDNRWIRREGDIATRIAVRDLEGLLKKPLVVEHGTRALLFRDGAFAVELGPGRYDAAGLQDAVKDVSLMRSLVGPGSVIDSVLVSSAPHELTLAVPGVLTQDAVALDVSCALVFRVGHPIAFSTNVMQAATSFTEGQIRQRLFAELRNSLAESLGKRPMGDLRPDLKTKEALEAEVARHLRHTLELSGLSLVQFRTLELRNDRLGTLIAFAGETTLLDREVKLYAARSAVLQAMREAVNSDRMNEVRTGEQLRDFLAEIDKHRILRENELLEYARDWEERHDQHQVQKQYVLRRLVLEQDLALERLETIQRGEIDLLRVEGAIGAKRKAFEAQQDMEWRQFQLELQKKLATDEAKRVKMTWMTEQLQAILRTQTDSQARLIEVKRGLTTQQLAIMALSQQGAEGMKALAVMFQADATAQSASSREVANLAGKHAQDMKDVAMAAVHGRHAGPTVVATGGLGGATVVTAGGCGHCGVVAASPGTTCSNCGQPLRS